MISDLVEQFRQLRPRYEDLGRLLQGNVTALLENSGIAYDHITYRVKSEDSLREKIIHRGYHSLNQCEDLCGVRVVLLYASDVDLVARAVAEQFQTIRLEDKRPGKGGRRASFGYSSVHLILGGPPPRLNHLVCELQIRTMMQHGWAQIEHRLHYKGPGRHDSEYVRELHRLAALLELADQSFMKMRDNVQQQSRPKKRSRRGVTWLEEVPESIQRDAAFDQGVLVWSQSRNGDPYRLRVQQRGPSRWLTTGEERETLARTDGRRVVAYRPTQGAVLYDLENPGAGARLLTQGGCPGGLSDSWAVIQGEGSVNGLETGITLVSLEDGTRRQLSKRGDSPRIDSGWVVWQEHFEGNYHLVGCPIGGIPRVLAYGASQPALQNGLVVWLEGGAAPGIRARDLLTGHVCPKIQAPAGFLDVRDFRTAYLVNQGQRNYNLVVFDLLAQAVVLEIAWVTLPAGRGPVLTDHEVLWEAEHPRGGTNLRKARLPRSVWSQVTAALTEADQHLQRRVEEHLAIGADDSSGGLLEMHLSALEELLHALQKRRFQPGGGLSRFSLRWLFHRLRLYWGERLRARQPQATDFERTWERRTRMIKERLVGPGA